MLIVIISLVLFYFIIFMVYRHLSRKKAAAMPGKSNDITILKKVTSNNNYDPILDVFTSLNQNMENNDLKLHANLRGYLDHGKTE